jgi:hypothetical protein
LFPYTQVIVVISIVKGSNNKKDIVHYMSRPSASHKSTNTSTICGNATGLAKHASSLLCVALLAVSKLDDDDDIPLGTC